MAPLSLVVGLGNPVEFAERFDVGGEYYVCDVKIDSDESFVDELLESGEFENFVEA